MIACNLHGKPIFLTEKDFAELSTKLLSDIGDRNIFMFKMAVLKNLGVRSDRPKYKRWELLFLKRLMEEIQNGKVLQPKKKKSVQEEDDKVV